MSTPPAPPHIANAGQFDRAINYASAYDYAALANIYNQGRVDYIVPMPMNARRMEEYVRHYDVVLDASVVALNGGGEETGIGMLGLRDQRAWITRLGVIPERRGHKVGQFIMETLLSLAQERGAAQAQLEVIEGNQPAHTLFRKLGFEETRKLLIIRRPPGSVKGDVPDSTLLTPEEITACLRARTDRPSWLDETPSLLHAGLLEGLRIGGEWVIYRKTPVQLSAFVLSPCADPSVLIRAVHRRYPMLDTKIENVDTSLWSAYQSAGYFEAFARLEMLTRF